MLEQWNAFEVVVQEFGISPVCLFCQEQDEKIDSAHYVAIKYEGRAVPVIVVLLCGWRLGVLFLMLLACSLHMADLKSSRQIKSDWLIDWGRFWLFSFQKRQETGECDSVSAGEL